MNTLTWVDEVTVTVSGDPGDPDVEFYHPELTNQMIEVLQKVVNEPDEWSCQAEGCNIGRPGDRPAPVGWVLHEPEDYGDRGGLTWAWTTVVQVGEKVFVVCEDCTPSNVYSIVGED